MCAGGVSPEMCGIIKPGDFVSVSLTFSYHIAGLLVKKLRQVEKITIVRTEASEWASIYIIIDSMLKQISPIPIK